MLNSYVSTERAPQAHHGLPQLPLVELREAKPQLPPRAQPMSLAELNTRLVRWYLVYLDGRDPVGPTGADNLRTMVFADAVQQALAGSGRVML